MTIINPKNLCIAKFIDRLFQKLKKIIRNVKEILKLANGKKKLKLENPSNKKNKINNENLVSIYGSDEIWNYNNAITDMMNIILVRIMFQKKFLMPQVLEDLNLKL